MSQDHVHKMFLKNVQFQESSKYFSRKWYWSYAMSYILFVKLIVLKDGKAMHCPHWLKRVTKIVSRMEQNDSQHWCDLPIKVLNYNDVTFIKRWKAKQCVHSHSILSFLISYALSLSIEDVSWQNVYRDRERNGIIFQHLSFIDSLKCQLWMNRILSGGITCKGIIVLS